FGLDLSSRQQKAAVNTQVGYLRLLLRQDPFPTRGKIYLYTGGASSLLHILIDFHQISAAARLRGLCITYRKKDKLTDRGLHPGRSWLPTIQEKIVYQAWYGDNPLLLSRRCLAWLPPSAQPS